MTSRPIKGTRARPADGAGRCAERARLEHSAKNRAENVMIVDLMRSDLSRVCAPGSVSVPGWRPPSRIRASGTWSPR